ncbi:MAG TPA: GerMN domain-containing protein, partial [Thermoanaerobaculia bacterium]|nr:GerMN domain-containing protein [Thermoanaerobaculia bacterium]
QALLDLQHGAEGSPDAAQGYYNALYASPLKVARIDRNGAEVRVHLTGYLEIADGCDGSRALAQLTETALQFSDVQRAQFLLEGQPLRDLLPRKN